MYLPCDQFAYLVGTSDLYLGDSVVLPCHGIDTHDVLYLTNTVDRRKNRVDVTTYEYEGSHRADVRVDGILILSPFETFESAPNRVVEGGEFDVHLLLYRAVGDDDGVLQAVYERMRDAPWNVGN